MLLFVKLLFLVVGVWAIFSGKLPAGLFRVMFGKGEYELTPNKTRLFGLFLSSTFLVSILVSFLLNSMVGKKAAGYAIIFEIIYILVIIISSIIVARKIRRHEAVRVDNSLAVSISSEQKTSNYGRKLLIIIGIVILGFITASSTFVLILVAISSITVGTRWTGDFRQDIIPLLVSFAFIGLGTFGIIKLIKTLRR